MTKFNWWVSYGFLKMCAYFMAVDFYLCRLSGRKFEAAQVESELLACEAEIGLMQLNYRGLR